MPKNPCMDRKSRKRTKNGNPITKSNEKLFCPPSMVLYDGCFGEYPIQWVCKLCSRHILSKEGVKKHLTNCSGQPRQSNEAPFIIPTTTNEESSYTCCNKVFTKHATLVKHLEEHEKSSYDTSGNKVEDRTIKTENASNASDNSDESED